jgi:hypothetical protein
MSELESLRRSIAMLNPRTPDALSREEAMEILRAAQDVERELWMLREGLKRLLADGP